MIQTRSIVNQDSEKRSKNPQFLMWLKLADELQNYIAIVGQVTLDVRAFL